MGSVRSIRRCCWAPLVGYFIPIPKHLIALIMAFGVGVLISAVAFELTEEAYSLGGGDAVALGLGAGALAFFAGDWYIDRMGGAMRKRPGMEQADGNAKAIAFGAALDGVPESAAIGLTLLHGGTVDGGARRRRVPLERAGGALVGGRLEERGPGPWARCSGDGSASW